MLKRFVFVLAALFLFFFLLDKIPLWSSDEGRYGEIAREMLESGNFVVPHFNYLPYLDKPVLPPLLTAGMFSLFGVNAFAARLVSVISALLGIFFLHRFTRRLFDLRTADFSALILLTTLGYVLVGRFAVIDMLMTFLLSMTLFFLMTALFEKKRGYYFGAYVLMGLAFLTKGLIALVLPFAIFFLFLLATKDLGEIKRMHLPAGMLIIAAIILPWMIMMSQSQPEFFDTFIVRQHFSRFATGTFGRRRPFWFFAPILIATAFPWTFFLPAAIGQALKEEAERRRKLLFLLLWTAVIFVFFSIPRSKLPYYILPVSMPIAILTGNLLAKVSAGILSSEKIQKLTAGAWKLLAFLIVPAVAGLHFYLIFGKKKAEAAVLAPVLSGGTLLIAAGCVISYFFFQREKREKAVFSLAATVYSGLLIAIAAMKMISPFQSTYDYADFLKSRLGPGDVVAVFSSPDRFSDLPFYLKRRVMVAGSDRGTLKEQSEELPAEEQKKYFLDSGSFSQLFNRSETNVFCLVASKRLQELTSGLQDFQILKEGGGKVLLGRTLKSPE